MKYNRNVELRKKISYLETRVDLLETELTNLDELLIETGFPQGIKTLKETALELIEDMRYEKTKDLS